MLSRSRPPRFWPRATDPSRWPHANAAWSSPKTFWPMNQARSRSTPRRRRRRAARAPFSRCRWSLTAASPACSWLVIALAARSRPRRHGWRRPSPITPPWRSRTRPSTKRPSGAHSLAKVLRTGKSEFHSHVTDEVLDAIGTDAEHRAALRALGLRSIMVVPLSARGRRLGAITFCSAESGRRYGGPDLAFAEDLAGRAAQAIDNARSEEHTSELQSLAYLVCRLLLEKKKNNKLV